MQHSPDFNSVAIRQPSPTRQKTWPRVAPNSVPPATMRVIGVRGPAVVPITSLYASSPLSGSCANTRSPTRTRSIAVGPVSVQTMVPGTKQE
jgi:hypothetical protein